MTAVGRSAQPKTGLAARRVNQSDRTFSENARAHDWQLDEVPNVNFPLPPSEPPITATEVTSGEAVPNNSRHAPRRRILKAGVVAFNDRHCTLSCTVRDLSPTGARLRCEGSIAIPDTFDLIIELDGLQARCEVMWRKGRELGVKFLEPPRQGAPKRSQVVKPPEGERASLIRRRPLQP